MPYGVSRMGTVIGVRLRRCRGRSCERFAMEETPDTGLLWPKMPKPPKGQPTSQQGGQFALPTSLAGPQTEPVSGPASAGGPAASANLLRRREMITKEFTGLLHPLGDLAGRDSLLLGDRGASTSRAVVEKRPLETFG